MKETIKKIVIETVQCRFLLFFYTMYYNCALKLLIYSVRKVQHVSCIYVIRSFSEPGWIPGYSDIDLAIVINSLPPASEALVVQRVHKAVRVLRIPFPMVGHALLLNENDFGWWLSYGNIRKLEFESWVKKYG
jgi:hypothetical protein